MNAKPGGLFPGEVLIMDDWNDAPMVPSDQDFLAAPPAEKAPPALPDGIGLSLDDVRALLAKEHETIVPKDDPMLMMVTLLNAYLSEVDKLHARHSKALTALMADKTDGYVRGVQEATDALALKLSASSLAGIRTVFADHAARLESFKNAMWYATAIVAVSALINVAVFVLRGLLP